MKITKHFEMGISGKFQTYKFGTTLEVEGDAATGEEAAEALQRAAVEATLRDIKALLETDSEFRLVWQARQEELFKFAKFQENQQKVVGKNG